MIRIDRVNQDGTIDHAAVPEFQGVAADLHILMVGRNQTWTFPCGYKSENPSSLDFELHVELCGCGFP